MILPSCFTLNNKPHKPLAKVRAIINRQVIVDPKNKTIGSSGYQILIKNHAIIDEQDPFVLYAIEVHSSFSRRILKK